MRIDVAWLARGIQYAVREVLRVLDRQLTFEDNVSCYTGDVVTPGTPDTTFTVTHNLGRIPVRWLANPQANATLWSVDRATWTDREIHLRCSGSGVVVTVTVW